ncbi:hypothetical protein VTN77DRAFT_2421 [Rasamsonia byssochlamydoides]|uniref:uncharacterized protein n=1 Tax=Rasamsonia byssochlamydoides TaxID=89139 RepID=UPI003742AB8C
MAISSPGIVFIVVNTVLMALAIVAVGLRFYARSLTRRNWDLSDHLLTAGVVMALGVLIVGILMIVIGGTGLHKDQVSPEQMLFLAVYVLWGVATTAVKLSILFFYRSLMTTKLLYGIMVLPLLFLVIVVLKPFIECRPLRYTWDKVHTQGTCSNLQRARIGGITVAVVNLCIDLTIFCMPLPVLWNLRMDTQKKIYISVILLLGLVVCTMSALRIKALASLSETDFTYGIVDDLIYAALEVELGTINACLPFYRPLFRKVFGGRNFLLSFFTRKNHRQGFDLGEQRARGYHEQKSFQHLDEDLYPLRQLTTESYAVRADSLEGRKDPGHITVTQSVDVFVGRR